MESPGRHGNYTVGVEIWYRFPDLRLKEQEHHALLTTGPRSLHPGLNGQTGE